MNMQTHVKINRKVAFFIEYSGTKKSKSCCHPPFHPPNFCRHSLKLLSPTLPKLMNWILLSPPPLSSDPDNPPKFGTCTKKPIKKQLYFAANFHPFPPKILGSLKFYYTPVAVFVLISFPLQMLRRNNRRVGRNDPVPEGLTSSHLNKYLLNIVHLFWWFSWSEITWYS